jgi:hypothetical protein
MSKLKNKLSKILRWVVILVLSIYVALFLILNFYWPLYYSHTVVTNLTANISKSPHLDTSFYAVYDKLFDDRHESAYKKYLVEYWYEFLPGHHNYKRNWPLRIAREAPIAEKTPSQLGYRIAALSLAFKINSEQSSERCFDFMMTDAYSKYCREFKRNDTIVNLKEKDSIIRFLVAFDKPWFYRIHPAQYQKEVDSVKKLFNRY